MPQAAGVFKQVAYKVEATYGTPPAAAGAQALRRVSSDLALAKDTYASAEIRADEQMADMRHGVRRVAGTLSGEVSPGTYKDFIAAAVRKAWVATAPMTGVDILVNAGTGELLTTGDFIAAELKVGDVIRLSAGALNAANANKNLLVTEVSSSTGILVLPLNGEALVTEGFIAGCTVTIVGKKTWVPETGHTNLSYSIEHWFSDVAQSEMFSGCKVTQVGLQLPPTGLATIEVAFQGQNVTTATAQYFTTPTAATTSGLAAAVNGLILVDGVAVANLTGVSLQIQSSFSGDPVVGSNTIPTLFPGRVLVSGQATAYFENAALRDAFLQEYTVAIVLVLSADNAADADFLAITLPACKLAGAAKGDGEGGIVQTLPFIALRQSVGTFGLSSYRHELTTIKFQDSLA